MRRVPPSSDRACATAAGSASAAGLSWAIWRMSSTFCVYELATVSRLEKFNQGLLSSVNSKEIVTACNLNDPEAYLMVSSTEGKGTSYLIFAPDERVRGAIVKFVPKFIANSAFK